MRLEINMVVSDAKEAGKYYSDLFLAEVLSVTDLDKGQNETMLKLGDIEVRVLDENPDIMLLAPTPESISSFWGNLFVEDIENLVERAKGMECTILSPVIEHSNGAVNAVFRDKYNHIWVLNK